MQILRTLPRVESDLILGKSYIDLISKKLNISSEQMLIDLEKYILNDTIISQRKKEFFNYTIELISLTFIIYKWGLLLFHLDNKMFGNFIVVFDTENSQLLAYEKEQKIILEDIATGKEIFRSIESKSLMAQMLIELISKNCGISIVETKADELKFDGSRVSYSEERFKDQQGEIKLLKANFYDYKDRLEKLQTIFIENFGKPNGFDQI